MTIHTEWIFWGVWILAGCIMLFFYSRARRPVCSALGGMLLGGLSLCAVSFFGGLLGITLTVNFFTTMVSLILGAPGVVMLVITSLLH